jgi:hypothetical protein
MAYCGRRAKCIGLLNDFCYSVCFARIASFDFSPLPQGETYFSAVVGLADHILPEGQFDVRYRLPVCALIRTDKQTGRGPNLAHRRKPAGECCGAPNRCNAPNEVSTNQMVM